MRPRTVLLPLLLALLAACAGSPSQDPGQASALTYADPAAAPGEWKLVANPASTSTRLLLDLVGPTDGTRYRGVGFTLQFDPARLKPVRFTGADGRPTCYMVDKRILMDRDETGDVPAVLQAGGVLDGKLMVGIFQTMDDSLFAGYWNTPTPARACGQPVLQVAFDLDSALHAQQGAAPLTVLKARVIADRIDAYDKRRPLDVVLKVGTLTLQ